jgi:2-polyprenyl-3-methyl-5-hydroxy-6-metoxy-1,4-benzoquinol methylase
MQRAKKKSDWFTKWRSWVDYLGPQGDWPRRELLDHCILSLLENVKGKNLLDAGCGEGRLSRLLAAQGAQVTGVDMVPELISLAKAISAGQVWGEALKRWPWLKKLGSEQKATGETKFTVTDITKLPLSWDNSFDIIVSCCVFTDVKNLNEVVFSLSRVLRTGGSCIVALPHPYYVRPMKKTIFCEAGRCIAYRETISQRLTITNYYRTFDKIINTLAAANLFLDRIVEPLLSTAGAKKNHREITQLRQLKDLPHPSKLPWFVVMRFRKLET